MTYEAKIKVQFDSKWTYTGAYSDDDMLPEEHITMEIPAEDLNTTQVFRFFSNFMRAIGHSELNIMKGACGTAFSDWNSKEDMRKVAEEYDLVLVEDLSHKIDEAVNLQKELDQDWANIVATQDPFWKKQFETLKERLVNEFDFTAESVDNLLT